MINYPTILKLPQNDINRQLYEMIVKQQKEITALTLRVKALESSP